MAQPEPLFKPGCRDGLRSRRSSLSRRRRAGMACEPCRIRAQDSAAASGAGPSNVVAGIPFVIPGPCCQVRERAPCGALECYLPELALPAGGSIGWLAVIRRAGAHRQASRRSPSAGRTRNRAGSGVNPPRATILSALPRAALLAGDAGRAPWRRPRSSWSRSWCRRLGTRLRTHGPRPSARPSRDSPPPTPRGSLPGWKPGPPGCPGSTAVSW